MGKIFILMGKSATGKDSVFKELLMQKKILYKTVVTYTTRPIREGEKEGVEYHFTNQDGLDKLVGEGKVVEQRAYNTIHGVWNYFTVDDGQIDLHNDNINYLIIGTIESYTCIRDYYGNKNVIPLYIDVEDGERLNRALNRERQQKQPKYAELCRRFLADCEDFSEEKICRTGIERRFFNNDVHTCVDEIVEYCEKVLIFEI